MKACRMHTMRRTVLALAVSAAVAGAFASTWSCSSSDPAGATSGSSGSGDGGSTGDGGGVTRPADCARTLAADPRFGARTTLASDARSESRTLAVPLPDGGVLVGIGGALAIFGADGRMNPAFVSDPLFFDPDRPRTLGAATVDAGGRVLIVFSDDSKNTTPPVRIARLTATGGLDPAYGQGGMTLLPFDADAGVVSLGASGVVADAAGAFVYVAFGRITRVYRVDANGALAASYGNAGSALEVPGSGIGIAPRGDGHAMFGLSLPSVSRAVVVSLNPSGLPEPTFAGDGGLAPSFFDSSGRLVALRSGDALVRGSSLAKRLHPDGTFDIGFGVIGELALSSSDGGAESSVLALAPRGDGSFAAFGKTELPSGETSRFVMRYDANGHACGAGVAIGEPVPRSVAGFSPPEATAVAYAEDGVVYLVEPVYDDAGEARSVQVLAYRETN